MSKKIKGCPLLLQSDTFESLTMRGEAHTRSYFLPCLKDECAAYFDGRCGKYDTVVDYDDKEH